MKMGSKTLSAILLLAAGFAQANATGVYRDADTSFELNEDKFILKNLAQEAPGIMEYVIDDNTTDGTSAEDHDVAIIGNGTANLHIGTTANGEKMVTSLIISSSAFEAISANALSSWISLATLTIQNIATVPALGENALPTSLTKIVVPEGMADEFANDENWGEYKEIIEDANGAKPSQSEHTTSLKTSKESSFMSLQGNKVCFAKSTDAEVVHVMTGITKSFSKTRSIVLSRGMYIVKTTAETKKFVVR